MVSHWVHDKTWLCSPLGRSSSPARTPTVPPPAFTVSAAHLHTARPQAQVTPSQTSSVSSQLWRLPLLASPFLKRPSPSLTSSGKVCYFPPWVNIALQTYFSVSSNRLRGPGAKVLLTHPTGSCSINVGGMNFASRNFCWVFHKHEAAATRYSAYTNRCGASNPIWALSKVLNLLVPQFPHL